MPEPICKQRYRLTSLLNCDPKTLWVSRQAKALFFSPVKDCQMLTFKREKDLKRYVDACVEQGWLIG
ncbi:MAG: hypothetical protein PHG73_01150 [Pygmaiobacter sp.]|nr:hypothetical protein [Pygmaiobacter sp.]